MTILQALHIAKKQCQDGMYRQYYVFYDDNVFNLNWRVRYTVKPTYRVSLSDVGKRAKFLVTYTQKNRVTVKRCKIVTYA